MGISDDFIGKNIKAVRELIGKSQKAVSEDTGLTIKALSEIENGHVQVRTENIDLIAESLGVSSVDLITGSPLKQASVFSAIEQLLIGLQPSAGFHDGQRLLALYLISGEERYLREYKSWKAQHTAESETLSPLLQGIRKFAE